MNSARLSENLSYIFANNKVTGQPAYSDQHLCLRANADNISWHISTYCVGSR